MTSTFISLLTTLPQTQVQISLKVQPAMESQNHVFKFPSWNVFRFVCNCLFYYKMMLRKQWLLLTLSSRGSFTSVIKSPTTCAQSPPVNIFFSKQITNTMLSHTDGQSYVCWEHTERGSEFCGRELPRELMSFLAPEFLNNFLSLTTGELRPEPPPLSLALLPTLTASD